MGTVRDVLGSDILYTANEWQRELAGGIFLNYKEFSCPDSAQQGYVP